MAVTRRIAPTGAPTVDTLADPSYRSRISTARLQATATGTSPISEGSYLTGTTANVRSGAGSFTQANLEKTAGLISRSQGLGDDGQSALLDYWSETGRWPDFSGGAGNTAGAVTAPPGGKLAAGQSANSWIWIAAIAGGLALVLLLTARKGRR